MGEALGHALQATGCRVRWVSEGRSTATTGRAAAAGFVDVRTIDGLRDSELVVSICPPEFALEVATAVARSGYSGTYVDANAIAPSTAAAVDAVVGGVGATFVDGGVIGGPGAPRLFLWGAAAEAAGRCFGPPATVEILEGPTYAASALKMVYAGWTKGTTALLFALVAAAEALGVDDALTHEWARSQPALGPRLDGAGPSAARAWRWSGEMREIAVTLDDVGVPRQFHDGAADVFARLATLRDDGDATVDDVVRLLLAAGGSG
jgi:3-hydroxyisobutyrate dehydrogenase-like beta-hydroxyacid dehydrogenase